MTRIALAIAATHPAFDGHFPSRPILPGVVLLDHSLRALVAHLDTLPPTAEARSLPRIAVAKFLSPVAPGESLSLDLDAGADRCSVRVFAGDGPAERVAMSGTFAY